MPRFCTELRCQARRSQPMSTPQLLTASSAPACYIRSAAINSRASPSLVLTQATAINLALNMARDATSSVYLLDLDMRNPSICRYLGVLPPHELSSYFTGGATAADVFFSIGPQNLAIAGSLTPTDRASELIGSGHLEALLEYIVGLGGSPIVLIDLPPVLVTDEALRVAPRVDATLLVVAEGRTRRDDLLRARDILADFPSAGVILNRATEQVGAGGYYYDYR
jgi:protein-tyrosine kinase